MRKIFIAGLILGVLSTAMVAFAQDPIKVGPNNYKLVHENDRVRVMEVRFKPGESIGMHSHPDHYVIVTSGGSLQISRPDGTKTDIVAKPGDVLWINAETHAAKNTGTTEIVGYVNELKEPKPVKEAKK
ncbi:MAG TPA: cupin domain-containing protein [Candidatus Krumholzibacteria bacterium]|nr:cupin domain-containing protein [Candidatus Krumholzibacteria bacterium]